MQAAFTLKPCEYEKNLPLDQFPNLSCMPPCFTLALRVKPSILLHRECYAYSLPSLLQITDTEHTDHVISLETQVESLGITGKALYYHLNRVLEERDVYIEVLITICSSAVKYGDLVMFLCFDVYV